MAAPTSMPRGAVVSSKKKIKSHGWYYADLVALRLASAGKVRKEHGLDCMIEVAAINFSRRCWKKSPAGSCWPKKLDAEFDSAKRSYKMIPEAAQDTSGIQLFARFQAFHSYMNVFG